MQGYNVQSQLGTGQERYELERSTQPLEVAGGHLFTSLAAGLHHACGIEAGTGSAWCWVRLEAGVVGLLSCFASLALQAQHPPCPHCCLSTQGDGAFGQLGDLVFASAEPIEVAGGHSFVQLAAGSRTTCGLKDDGSAWCCECALRGSPLRRVSRVAQTPTATLATCIPSPLCPSQGVLTHLASLAMGLRFSLTTSRLCLSRLK